MTTALNKVKTENSQTLGFSYSEKSRVKHVKPLIVDGISSISTFTSRIVYGGFLTYCFTQHTDFSRTQF